jgi:hypothetical protein
MEMNMEHWWNDSDREDGNTKRKHVLGANFTSSNRILPGPLDPSRALAVRDQRMTAGDTGRFIFKTELLCVYKG